MLIYMWNLKSIKDTIINRDRGKYFLPCFSHADKLTDRLCTNICHIWFQMVCAFVILYVLKSLKMISFTTGESQNSSKSTNSIIFVSFSTLVYTVPLALTYLLFMVSLSKHWFVLHMNFWSFFLDYIWI